MKLLFIFMLIVSCASDHLDTREANKSGNDDEKAFAIKLFSDSGLSLTSNSFEVKKIIIFLTGCGIGREIDADETIIYAPISCEELEYKSVKVFRDGKEDVIDLGDSFEDAAGVKWTFKSNEDGSTSIVPSFSADGGRKDFVIANEGFHIELTVEEGAEAICDKTTPYSVTTDNSQVNVSLKAPNGEFPEGITLATNDVSVNFPEIITNQNSKQFSFTFSTAAPGKYTAKFLATKDDSKCMATLGFTVTLGLAGKLDESFGKNGKSLVFKAFNPYVISMSEDGDGKFIISGNAPSDMRVGRLNRDGSVDNSFNGGNPLDISYSGQHQKNAGSFPLSNGKIIVYGVTQIAGEAKSFYLPLIIRLNSNGTYDETFGTAGKALVEQALAVVEAFPNGDGLLLVGHLDGKPAILKLDSNGNVDANFNGGKVKVVSTHAIRTRTAIVYDQKILFAGEYQTKLFQTDLNGNPDNGFGTSGYLALSALIGEQNGLQFGEPSGLYKTNDGSLLVTGGRQFQFSLAKITTSGSLVNKFGNGGYVITADQRVFKLQDTVQLKSGQFVSASYNYGKLNEDWSFVRFNGDGSIDKTFGTDGWFTVDLQGSYDRVAGMILGDNELSIFAAGQSRIPNENDGQWAIIKIK